MHVTPRRPRLRCASTPAEITLFAHHHGLYAAHKESSSSTVYPEKAKECAVKEAGERQQGSECMTRYAWCTMMIKMRAAQAPRCAIREGANDIPQIQTDPAETVGNGRVIDSAAYDRSAHGAVQRKPALWRRADKPCACTAAAKRTNHTYERQARYAEARPAVAKRVRACYGE